MASMAPGCLLTLAICGGIGYGVYQYLPRTLGGAPTVPRIFAALIGIVGGFGLQSLYSVITGYGRGAGSRKALHARALSDGAPEDGEPIIATGVVRADRPLTSPLGGVACAAYDYRMFVYTRTSSRREDQKPVYWGYAAQPFAIDSSSRRYPVASVPLPGDKGTPLAGDAVVKRARDYVRSTGWETVEFKMLGTLDTVFQRVGDDSTTGTRRDFAAENAAPPDVSILQLEETVLPIGATVSAFGTWSAAMGAIVAPPSPLPGSRVVVAPGGPEALDGKPGVPQSLTSYVVGAIVMLGLAVGLFYVARLILPTVEY
jgi:hypothetical protein